MPTTTRNRQPIPDYDVFAEGEIVRLHIGGPLLQIIDVCEDCGEVETVHVDSDNDLAFNVWPPEALVRVN